MGQEEHYCVVDIHEETDHATIYPDDPDSEFESIAVVSRPRCAASYRCELKSGHWVCDETESGT
jgi:hypothetical protein